MVEDEVGLYRVRLQLRVWNPEEGHLDAVVDELMNRTTDALVSIDLEDEGVAIFSVTQTVAIREADGAVAQASSLVAESIRAAGGHVNGLPSFKINGVDAEELVPA